MIIVNSYLIHAFIIYLLIKAIAIKTVRFFFIEELQKSMLNAIIIYNCYKFSSIGRIFIIRNLLSFIG